MLVGWAGAATRAAELWEAGSSSHSVTVVAAPVVQTAGASASFFMNDSLAA